MRTEARKTYHSDHFAGPIQLRVEYNDIKKCQTLEQIGYRAEQIRPLIGDEQRKVGAFYRQFDASFTVFRVRPAPPGDIHVVYEPIVIEQEHRKHIQRALMRELHIHVVSSYSASGRGASVMALFRRSGTPEDRRYLSYCALEGLVAKALYCGNPTADDRALVSGPHVRIPQDTFDTPPTYEEATRPDPRGIPPSYQSDI
jgi:hypothetical protein